MRALAVVALALALSAAGEELKVFPSAAFRPSGSNQGKLVLTNGEAVVRAAKGARWSGVAFRAAKPVSLVGRREVVARVRNRENRPLALVLQAKTPGEPHWFVHGSLTLGPRETGELVAPVSAGHHSLPKGAPTLPGMSGYEVNQDGYRFDPAKVDTVVVFRRESGNPPVSFAVESVVVRGEAAEVRPPDFTRPDFFPFVDALGQFAHGDWPGKAKSEEEMRAAGAEEEAWLGRHTGSPIPDADRFGGWAGGPQLEATGLFRVTKLNGRWTFVDPDGRLFYSQGVNGVRVSGQTGVTGRERFFAWLPKRDDARFKSCWCKLPRLSSRDDSFYANFAKYDSFSFARANLIRKYGDDWAAHMAETAHRRLKAWGLNTVGNWSDPQVMKLGLTPYTDEFETTRTRYVVGAKGVRRKFPDVFAPEFVPNLEREAKRVAARSGRDPWCLGWFVDNELDWGMAEGELVAAIAKAKPDQPARQELVRRLQARHGATATVESATRDELLAFEREVATRYFSSVRAAIDKVAPGRLYLGCRFAGGHRMPAYAVKAAADWCDVVSANLYAITPNASYPKDAKDRPVLVGEFHFGALDRGMLNTGLVPTPDQNVRAEAYKAYVRAALGDPRIVGAHWFLWRDQPLTGRADGECFGCGLVDVTDRPYPEMVAAARELAKEIYGGGETYESASFVPGVKGRATGFFHVERQADGTWWTIDPLGRGFYPAGVQSASFWGCTEFGTKRRRYHEANVRRFGTAEKWADATARQLAGWGFNMLGMWCARELEHRCGLVYARNLEMGAAVCRPDLDPDLWIDAPQTSCGKFPNVFHPGFAAHCARVAAKKVAPWKDDPYVFGWFVDNELSWFGGCRKTGVAARFGLFERVRVKPDGHSAKRALVEYLKGKGLRLEDEIPDAVKVGFLELAAEAYFRTTTEAIRAADPNHMVLGPRFAGVDGAADDCVWRVAGRYCDAVAFNCYPTTDPDRNWIAADDWTRARLPETFAWLYGLAKKPLMVTEWSFLAVDAGRPCLRGAGQRFRTQAERTRATELCLRHFLAMPFVIGWNWFRWVDQPPAGTISPAGKPSEDSNYGLVSEDGEPYPVANVFSRYLRDVAKWRREPPPQETEARVSPDVLTPAVVRKFRMGCEGRAVSFADSGDGYGVEVGEGVRVCGMRGKTNVFFSVERNGLPVFGLAPNLNWNCGGKKVWTGVTRVSDVRWDPAAGGGRLVLRGECEDHPRYAVTVACDFAGGRKGLVASVESVENLGSAPLDFNRMFLHQRAAFAPVADQPEVIGPKVWKEPARSAWFASDGRWCGGMTRAPRLANIRYYLDTTGRQHADCAFQAAEPTVIPPGGRLSFGDGAWALFLFGDGGREGFVRQASASER